MPDILPQAGDVSAPRRVVSGGNGTTGRPVPASSPAARRRPAAQMGWIVLPIWSNSACRPAASVLSVTMQVLPGNWT